MARPPQVNESPRMSANELAKYMVSTETGKIGIIKNAIKPNTAAAAQYSHARDCIKKFLSSDNRNVADIHEKIAFLQARADNPASTPWIKRDSQYSIDALNDFLTLRNQMGGFDYIEMAQRGQPHLTINTVDVSVNLDLLSHRTYRRTEQVGGLIFRFTKSDEKKEETKARRVDMGKYVATLAHIQVSENAAGNRTPYYGLSSAVDVQFGQAMVCPRNYTERYRNIENACWFIANSWDALKAQVRAEMNG